MFAPLNSIDLRMLDLDNCGLGVQSFDSHVTLVQKFNRSERDIAKCTFDKSAGYTGKGWQAKLWCYPTVMIMAINK